jgi:uncharacterized protein (TIGR02246 family)
MEFESTIDMKSTEKELELLYKELLVCWNNADAHAYASLFTENANVIGFDGSQMNGKAQIESALGEIFKDHKVASYISVVEEVRPVGNNAYLLRAVAGMVPPGDDEIKQERNAIQSLLAVKKHHTFLIELFHNTPAVFHGRPDLSEKLTMRLRAELKKEFTNNIE